ncbi:hypothetical protein [Halopolyspora algeriensis]|nr:hypothetical protein [Halopolyspora algeriensis]
MADLLHGLVDDAGLFPPTALDMPAAVERHRADQQAGEPMLTHRFLCPASRLDELRGQLTGSDRFRLGLIADQGADGLSEVLDAVILDHRLSLALLEIPLAAFRDQHSSSGVSAALRELERISVEVAAYFEPATLDDVDEVIAELAASAGGRRRVGGKLRCGGVRAELFPGPQQVAHFLLTCVGAGLPLKATAGLHQAVRHQDPETGFTHHGYLNLLLAAAVAAGGAGQDEVRTVLEIEDSGELARRIGALDRDAALRARSVLVSYGSCSTGTPPQQARDILESTRERKGAQ